MAILFPVGYFKVNTRETREEMSSDGLKKQTQSSKSQKAPSSSDKKLRLDWSMGMQIESEGEKIGKSPTLIVSE